MTETVKEWLRTFAPRSLLYGLPTAFHKRAVVNARRRYEDAARTPEWLEASRLPAFQARHSPPRPYPYDRAAALRRAESRIARLSWLLKRHGRRATEWLEMACFDGLASGVLAGAGHRATAIDRSDRDFDGVVRRSSVTMAVMDAERLGLESNRFDCVFSYNAFEHFEHPDRALAEALRVVKPGGVVYLDFGPLYFSPWGLHEYQSVTVPYCHLLFRQADLEAFVAQNHLGWLDFTDVNGWPIGRYRSLWASVADRARVRHCYERRNCRHVDLIANHPTCFRAKTDTFEDLLVSNVEILLQRTTGAVTRP